MLVLPYMINLYQVYNDAPLGHIHTIYKRKKPEIIQFQALIFKIYPLITLLKSKWQFLSYPGLNFVIFPYARNGKQS